MVATLKVYPIPGTRAAEILAYIQANPGTTKNQIIEKLGMNPSVVRDAVKTLMVKGMVEDQPDAEKRHHFHAKEPKL